MDFGVWMLRQRYATRTIAQYSRILERLTEWLKKRRKTLRSVTWKDILDYAETLPNRHASRMGLQSALKAYWRFLGRRDCPAWAVPTPKKPRKVSRPLTIEQVRRVFDVARSMGPTPYAVVKVLYHTGIRREDLATLRWDAFLSRDCLRIVGKGRVERDVPIVPAVWEALEQLPRTSEYVFEGRWGGHVNPGTVNKWIAMCSEMSGVPMTPHRFRDTFITVGYTETKDLAGVQAVAGHADPRTTRDYILTPWSSLQSVASAVADAALESGSTPDVASET